MPKYTFISDNSDKKFTIEYEIRDSRPYSIREYEVPGCSAGDIIRKAYKSSYQPKQGNITCYTPAGRVKRFR